MTPRQVDYINEIKRYIEINHISPTTREICNLVGTNSPASVNSMLKRLKKCGYITYLNGKARTIVILK